MRYFLSLSGTRKTPACVALQLLNADSTTPHEDQARTEAWVQKMIGRPANGTTDFVVTLRSEKEQVIGVVGIKQLDSREIGFIFARKYWGTGIPREAVDATLNYLFEKRKLEEVIAEVEPGNKRCLKFLERQSFVVSGFTERVWEVDGVWWDSVQLVLTKKLWERTQICRCAID